MARKKKFAKKRLTKRRKPVARRRKAKGKYRKLECQIGRAALMYSRAKGYLSGVEKRVSDGQRGKASNPSKFRTGDRVVVSFGSGVDSGKSGVIISRQSVATDGRGVAKIEGHYKPTGKNEEFVKLDGGRIISMFKSRLSKMGNNPKGIKVSIHRTKHLRIHPDQIRAGDRVTILVHAGGIGKNTEWKPKTGRAVMRGPAGWVLNMGGRFGTPDIADETNIVKISRRTS